MDLDAMLSAAEAEVDRCQRAVADEEARWVREADVLWLTAAGCTLLALVAEALFGHGWLCFLLGLVAVGVVGYVALLRGVAHETRLAPLYDALHATERVYLAVRVSREG